MCVRYGPVMKGLGVAVDARFVFVIRGVNVAIRADRAMVRQSPEGSVVECGPHPGRCVVAGGASPGKVGRNVIRHTSAGCSGALPGSNVATVAIRGQIPRIVVVHMAGRARGFVGVRMRAGQRETRGIVIELTCGPGGNRMAGGALRRGVREAGGNMIRNASTDRRGSIPIRHVAAIAVRRIEGEIVVDMAGSAGRRRGRHVRTGQSETCDAVIKRSRVPAFGGVAIGAVSCGKRRPSGTVDWVARLLPLGKVAARITAIGLSNFQIVVVIDVA